MKRIFIYMYSTAQHACPTATPLSSNGYMNIAVPDFARFPVNPSSSDCIETFLATSNMTLMLSLLSCFLPIELHYESDSREMVQLYCPSVKYPLMFIYDSDVS